VEALEEERERTILTVAAGVCVLVGRSFKVRSLVVMMTRGY